MTRAIALLCAFLFAFAATADSCDLSVTPAATLLLPYFEVDFESRSQTTIFTVTNVTNLAQVARVTLWTDYSYPVLSFNLYLTGYDQHSIDLFDVLHGRISGPRLGIGTWVSPRGPHSGEDNRLLDDSECGRLPAALEPAQLDRLLLALQEGRTPTCNEAGRIHMHAVGYATIDVVGNCGSAMPTDDEYFTEDLRYTNALIGDYQQVNAAQQFASGNPMVHIRALPEGGTPLTRAMNRHRYGNGFAHTFYERFQHPLRPRGDARQPLPSTFAARWDSQTAFKIWRQGTTGPSATCGDYADNALLVVSDIVLFDEDENGEGLPEPICSILCVGDLRVRLPSTSFMTVRDDEYFPHDLTDTTLAGWVYLNLDDPDTAGPTQSWVVVANAVEGRYTTEINAAALGNGCSNETDVTAFTWNGSAEVLP
jgi:hypothetical protein